MPKVIPARTRSRYDALIRAGHTKTEAAKRAGVSLSWAKKRSKELEARGKATPRDSVAPKVIGLHQQGRSAPEIAEITGLPKEKVANFIKLGQGEGSWTKVMADDEASKVGPIAREDLSDPARDCLDDFARFRARYLASTTVPWQEEAAQRVVGYLDNDEKQYVVINCPQGAGKTRLFSHDIPAWITARNRANRGIIGSLSQNLSYELTGNLRDTLERTVPAMGRPADVARGLALESAEATLAGEYGYFKPTNGSQWRRERFVVAQHSGASVEKEPTWAGFSREAKFLGWRVDFMVWDDLVNTDMLRNQDRVDDLYRWWDSEAESRLDPGGLCLLVGQRLRSNDIYRYCLDKKIVIDEFDDSEDASTRPQYHHIVYKAHYDENCDGTNDRHRKDAPAYPEGCMLDPARVKWRDIQEKKTAGTFEVVYQQQDSDPTNVLVQKEWVNGGVGADGVHYEGCWDKDRVIGQLPPVPIGSQTVRYITVDPSPTRYWSVIDWLYVLPGDTERLAGYRYLINIARKKMTAPEFLDWSRDQATYVGLAEDWVGGARKNRRVEYLVMEQNAAQRWAMQYEHFRRWAQDRGVNVLPHNTTNNKSDPDYGVWATLPTAYRHGRVRLPGGDQTSRNLCYPLVQEVTSYPDGPTDDCVMSQWFGEYNLQNLVAYGHQSGTLYQDMPSWLRRGDGRTASRVAVPV